jgi:uncharacterized protein (TIGR02271 family)
MTANLHDQKAQGQAQAQAQAPQQAEAPRPRMGFRPADEEWVDRREERLSVGKETIETGHVKLHRYVDATPVEKTVHLSHEEFDVERMPINADEPIRGTVGELEQELTLHGERGVMHKETVPVERVRLITKNVDEDKTFRDEIRKERIEVEQDRQAAPSAQAAAQPQAQAKPRPA